MKLPLLPALLALSACTGQVLPSAPTDAGTEAISAPCPEAGPGLEAPSCPHGASESFIGVAGSVALQCGPDQQLVSGDCAGEAGEVTVSERVAPEGWTCTVKADSPEKGATIVMIVRCYALR